MVTAVDTNVLLDVFGADESFGPRSKATLTECLSQGSLIACDVVWAEAAAWFPSANEASRAMERLGVDFLPLDRGSALRAGLSWQTYRQRGGKRQRIVADFLIGAHASEHAERLLSRDRGFYRECFEDLVVIDPARA